MLNRRSFLQRFLGGLAGTVALSAIDVDQLLWMPGEKTIFLPSVVSGNQFISLDVLAREALEILRQNLTFTSHINRAYDARFPLGRIAA